MQIFDSIIIAQDRILFLIKYFSAGQKITLEIVVLWRTQGEEKLFALPLGENTHVLRYKKLNMWQNVVKIPKQAYRESDINPIN